MKSILHKFNTSCYFSEPFPHLVIENCLDDNTLMNICNDYPDQSVFVNLDKYNNKFSENTRYNISANSIINKKALSNLSDTTINFFKFHTSDEYFSELIKIFEKDIKKYYPSFYSSIKNRLNENLAIVRGSENNGNKITLDCQFAINSTSSKESAVIEPHVDNPVELFAGLLYLRDENDSSTGGNLEIYEVNKNKKPIFYGKHRVKRKNLSLVKTIEYKKNTLVILLNTSRSVHTVSKRSASSVPRKFLNIVVETDNYYNTRLFNYEKNFFTNFSEKIGLSF